nr:MAG TPA: hypothetical protein [Bacteriophage sp.]
MLLVLLFLQYQLSWNPLSSTSNEIHCSIECYSVTE